MDSIRGTKRGTLVPALRNVTGDRRCFQGDRQVNYRVPEMAATGLATVRHTAGGVTVTSALNIVPVYPGIFTQNIEGQAAAQVARIRNGATLVEAIGGPVTIGPAAEQATLILYGSGLNSSADVSATIDGVRVSVAYAARKGPMPGWTRSIFRYLPHWRAEAKSASWLPRPKSLQTRCIFSCSNR